MATRRLRLYRATAGLRVDKGVGATETYHVAGNDGSDAMDIATEVAPDGYKVLHLDLKGKVYLREK